MTKKTPSSRGPRSPGYPAIPLKDAIDRALVLKEYSPARKPIPVDTALSRWGYKPKSGAGLQMIASLKKFGLISDHGSKDQRTVQLTERAWRILTDPRPDSLERASEIRAAALAPRIHSEIRERWPHGLPDDTTMQVWLVQEKAFNEKAVSGFLKDLRSTFEYAKLDSEPGTDPETGIDSGGGAIQVGSYVQWTSMDVMQFPEPRKVLGFSDDGEWAFIEGSKTGVPVSELTLEKPPAEEKRHQDPPPNPHAGGAGRHVPEAGEGMEESRWKLPSGSAIVILPSTMTERDFKVLRGQIDLLEMSSLDDTDDD